MVLKVTFRILDDSVLMEPTCPSARVVNVVERLKRLFETDLKSRVST